ncbi:unnamed protein product [Penicillium pancosmium]
MEKMLARFSEIVQMGYSTPRLVQAFCDHVTLRGHFHRFFQLYIYRFICHYYATTNRLTSVASFSCKVTSSGTKVALQDFAGFLADRILLRFTVWSTNYLKQANSEGVSARLPKPLVLRDHARCVITGSDGWRELSLNLRTATISDDGQEVPAASANHSQLRGVYIIPPKLLPSTNASQARPSGEEENFLQDMRSATILLMEMFEPNIRDMLDEAPLRSFANMLTLDKAQHELFASSLIYFEATSHPCKYCLWSPLEDGVGRRSENETVVKLEPHEGIPAPSRQFLSVHRSVTRILAISGAKGYMNWKVGRWEEKIGVAE